MFERLFKVIQAAFNNLLGKVEDPAIMLEQTYQDLQNQVIQFRQAVAQAIATEKQLEQTLSKNKDQAATWQNRAAMAVQQNNDELARQALQRKQQFAQAAADLEIQLKQQKDATSKLRQRLTELENELQKAQTKKQMLIARDKAAKATMKANEILSKTNTGGATSDFDRMEAKIAERENKAAAMAELSGDTLEKQFKSFEGQSDIEMELLALKNAASGGTGGNDGQKLISQNKHGASQDAVLLDVKHDNSAIDVQEVRELKTEGE